MNSLILSVMGQIELQIIFDKHDFGNKLPTKFDTS